MVDPKKLADEIESRYQPQSLLDWYLISRDEAPVVVEALRLLGSLNEYELRDRGCPRPLVMGEHACKNRKQCWEPCGDLGNHSEYARAAPKEA